MSLKPENIQMGFKYPEYGKLHKSVCYLSGPMQYAKDGGIGWRQKFISLIEPLGIRIIDPTNKPKALGNECHEEEGMVEKLKKEEKWKELTEYAKAFVRFDCRSVDIADFIVVYLNPKVFTVGTIHELLIAENQQKPIFLILEGGKLKTSAWLFGIVDYENMFDSIEECVDHLKKLDGGQLPLDNKWVLMRDYLNKGE